MSVRSEAELRASYTLGKLLHHLVPELAKGLPNIIHIFFYDFYTTSATKITYIVKAVLAR